MSLYQGFVYIFMNFLRWGGGIGSVFTVKTPGTARGSDPAHVWPPSRKAGGGSGMAGDHGVTWQWQNPARGPQTTIRLLLRPDVNRRASQRGPGHK